MRPAVRILPGVDWERSEGLLVFVSMSQGEYFVFEGDALQLWEWLLELPSREAVQERLAQTYALSREEAAVELDRFCSTLSARGLCERFAAA